MIQAPTTRGIHHLGLTVPDIAATRAFFVDALGFAVVGEKPDYPAVFVSDGVVMLTLWQAEDPATAAPFDRRRAIGLHHVAFKVDGEDALAATHARLRDWPGVAIEFGPGPVSAGSAARHLICSVPGGIRVEFFAAPAA